MTFWLVTLFAMLAILSPVLWLRPTRRDRRLGQLRQHARQAGIAVKFAKPPLHAPPAGLVSYRWTYAQSRPGPHFVLVRDTHASEALKPFVDGWRWRIEPLRPLPEAARECLEQALAQLPDDALVLESARGSLTLWWGESLEVARFVSCQEALAAARDALASTGRQYDAAGWPR